MNIFILHKDPKVSAQYYVDTHVVKMPLETAQLLCTALVKWVPDLEVPYKPTHPHHPCTKWAAESFGNFQQLVTIGLAICSEYTYRYGKVHKCEAVIRECFELAKKQRKKGLQVALIDEVTRYAQAMPDEYKNRNAIIAYRNYYVNDKKHLFKWTRRKRPEFINNLIRRKNGKI